MQWVTVIINNSKQLSTRNMKWLFEFELHSQVERPEKIQLTKDVVENNGEKRHAKAKHRIF